MDRRVRGGRKAAESGRVDIIAYSINPNVEISRSIRTEPVICSYRTCPKRVASAITFRRATNLPHLRQPPTRPFFDTASSSNNTAKMATELTVQSERAFQKQPHIFLNTKAKASSKKTAQGRRWYKEVGLGFRTPKTAIEGTYIDKKCPFTSQVSIRGRVLVGKVVSTKMHRTLVIRREYLHYVPKYNRYERRHKNLSAHVSPAFRVEEGDMVTVGQCRPLSKTVRFNVLKVHAKTSRAVKSFSKF
ncbi:Nucleic acid-binding OB-fold [Penicillium concentricum]|uniref:Nucleic acid-binding OB-fold n=2 Tax=Penicillium TaxID=5073 RepID=A0A9W9VLM0_9EURO|nr:Nucleic acid-binding OB-fold [Penicillium concentricum]KAJ5385075.1 Nucleic acid-binding OB-fold [Penicillium concentricum]